MADDWELKFEHIDWIDISDAELSGNQEALEQLMNKSLEIKQQVASHNNSFTSSSAAAVVCPPPPLPSTPLSTTPLTHSTPNEYLPPQSTPKDELQEPVFFHSARSEDMSTSKLNLSSGGTPNISRNTSGIFRKPSSSYASATRSSGKRKFADRVGVSPISIPKKRQPLRDLVISPTPSSNPVQTITTPLTDVEGGEMEMETSTPEGLDRPSRFGVQRRLFGSFGQQQQLQTENSSANNPPWHTKANDAIITDVHKLAQRQKQIEFGKNTVGYEIFTQSIPKWKRKHSDPWTPDKYKICSTRAWQGQMKLWRKNLHRWDPPTSSSNDENKFTTEDAELCEIPLDIGESPLDF